MEEEDNFLFLSQESLDEVPTKQPRPKQIVQIKPKIQTKARTEVTGEGSHFRKGSPDLSVIDIVPPPRYWSDIAQYRKKYVSYMPYDAPHISFINPFLVGDDLPGAAAVLTAKFRDVVPCRVTMAKLDTMPRRRKNNITVFVLPEVDPPDGLDILMKIFLSVFPQCDDLWQRHGQRFTPHLTIAQFESEEEHNAIFPELQENWKPFTFELNEIYFITRPVKRHPFEVRQVVPIGQYPFLPLLGPGLQPKNNKLHRSLVVVGIPNNFDKDQLFALFSPTGNVLSTHVMNNSNMTATWCCGVIEYGTREECENVAVTYDGKLFPGIITYVKRLVYLMMVVDGLDG